MKPEPATLLLVEDDESLRRVLARELERMGFAVNALRDGETGDARHQTTFAGPPPTLTSAATATRCRSPGPSRA